MTKGACWISLARQVVNVDRNELLVQIMPQFFRVDLVNIAANITNRARYFAELISWVRVN